MFITIFSLTYFKALSLQFSGFAYTKWEKPQKVNKSGKPKPTIHIENREDYVSTTNYLIGSEMANPKQLEPGKYSYNFMVQIPQNVPSTFASPLGYIRYELIVNADYGGHIVSLYNSAIHIEQWKDLRLLDRSGCTITRRKRATGAQVMPKILAKATTTLCQCTPKSFYSW